MTATMAAAAAAEVELLFFQIGGVRYGADAAEILRVDRAEEGSRTVAPMGSARDAARVLVFQSTAGATSRLKVDLVYGIRAIPVAQLRRLPPGMGPEGFAVGVWLDGDTPVLLVDLAQMAKQLGG